MKTLFGGVITNNVVSLVSLVVSIKLWGMISLLIPGGNRKLLDCGADVCHLCCCAGL